MRFNTVLLSFCCLWLSWVQAQDFSIYTYRNVGPLRGGRVTTVAGTAAEPGSFYLGATGGGVWKTTDYGTTWKNVSDGFFATPSIGAIAVDQQDPNIVYVGTGSDGLRSNVIVGKGVYKSVDGGATWQSIGLEKVGQIGAVEIHPDNHNIVYVAAIGQPFSHNPERGIYKTTNGGRSWEKILYVSEETGFADLEMLPGNPEVLFAAAWKGQRKPWTILSGGPNETGGIYKSVDGGENWERLSEGLPQGLIGKIDLAVTPADSKVLYALVEAPEDEGGVYQSVDQGQSFEQVSSKGGLRTRPFYFTNIEADPQHPDVVYVMATGYYKSTDGGKNWRRKSSPHSDNHDMWVNPNNPDLFILANDGGANVTFNGGDTWSTSFNQPTAELYQVEVDDQFPYWLYAGQQDNYSTIAVPSNLPTGRQAADVGYIINTGGCETGPAVPKPGNPDIVYANCKGRFSVYNKATGIEQAYYVGASNMYGHNPMDLEYRFQRVSPIHVSPHDPDVVYHASQFVHKTHNDGVDWETISPDLTAFEADKQVISGSPITRDITGEEFYSTIYALRESPLEPGLIWTGANDGPVHVSRDGGANWEDVTPEQLPPGGRVDAVEPSPHDPAKAYIAVLRYQLGDFEPYIYQTTDYGQSWQRLTDGTNGIPADHPTRVVREHPAHEGVLLAGTEFGLFISLDDGETWQSFQQNLPTTPVTDIKLHQGDLVLSTMGRGFWIADDVFSLDLFQQEAQAHDMRVPQTVVRYTPPRVRTVRDLPRYERPTLPIDFYLAEAPEEPVRLSVYDSEDERVLSLVSEQKAADDTEVVEDMDLSAQIVLEDASLAAEAGPNRYRWNMRAPGPWHRSKSRRFRGGPMVPPGTYRLVLEADSQQIERIVTLAPDPRLPQTRTAVADIEASYRFAQQVIDLLSRARRFEQQVDEQLAELKEGDAKREKLEDIKAQLREKDIIYPQPKLIDQMEYLYYQVGGDQKVGTEMKHQYQDLKEEFAQIVQMMET